jgi:FkbM family methyltransferase
MISKEALHFKKIIKSHGGFLCTCFLEQACIKYSGEPWLLEAAKRIIQVAGWGHFSLAVVAGRLMFAPDDDAIGRVMKKDDYNHFQEMFYPYMFFDGGDFLEIGSNVGCSTIQLCELSNGKVIAIEPDEKNFDLLQKNLLLNKVNHALCIKAAVTSYNGKCNLYLDKSGNCGDHRTYTTIEQRNFTHVDCMTLSKAASYVDNLKMIKIDAQGQEVDILRSGREVLREAKDLFVQVEFWPKGILECGHFLKDFMDEVFIDDFMVIPSSEIRKDIVIVKRHELENLLANVPMERVLVELYMLKGAYQDRVYKVPNLNLIEYRRTQEGPVDEAIWRTYGREQ